MPTNKGGRPKTSAGHFDDGVGHLFDAMARTRGLRELRAKHYRAERDEIHRIETDITEAARAFHIAGILEQLEQVPA